ncbi:MAG TPA: phosphate signaling complex protein PhoU [Rhodocyclaceae bacterium]|nr:phosphate signaling complex protein PhoU [Rhodocyclaceae bacterium]
MKEHMQHVTRAFDEELNRLRTHVLEMGGLVESQILAATNAYHTGEIEVVSEVVANDRKVNQFEQVIDDECIQVIAKRQPAAFDLRLVMSIGKMVTDLERIGDEAKKIAKGARRLHERGPAIMPRDAVDVRHVASMAVAMLRQALDAFARLDTDAAVQVIRSDDDVDVGFKAIIRQLITFMMEDPRTISGAIDVIWIARAVERIGDHAKNIAEQVIYIAEGRDIRHPPKESKE